MGYFQHSGYTLDPAKADVVLFLSDLGEMQVFNGIEDRWGSNGFLYAVRRDICKLSSKQEAAVRKFMAVRKFVPPPPYEPYVHFDGVYQGEDCVIVALCPGCRPPVDLVQSFYDRYPGRKIRFLHPTKEIIKHVDMAGKETTRPEGSYW